MIDSGSPHNPTITLATGWRGGRLIRNIVRHLRKINAAKRVARQLSNELAIRYGFSKAYTVDQITVTCKNIKLDACFLGMAYAQYLDLPNYLSIGAGTNEQEYTSLRKLVAKYIDLPQSAYVHEARISTYVAQVTSLNE